MRWRIECSAGVPVAIAGIWEYYPADHLLSFSMLTINANGHPLMPRVHKPDDEKRMVMILDLEQYEGGDSTERWRLRRRYIGNIPQSC